MVSRPPSGIASRALTARLSSAVSSCCGSTVVGHSAPSMVTATLTASPSTRRSMSSMASSRTLASTASGVSRCSRA